VRAFPEQLPALLDLAVVCPVALPLPPELHCATIGPGKIPRYAPVAAVEDDANFDEIENKALDQVA